MIPLSINPPISVRHHSAIKPDEWNDWITFGGAVIGIFVWIWRHTLKAFLKWLWNGIRAPQRIEAIMLKLDMMQHDLTTTIGLARATWDAIPNPIWQSDTLGLCVHVNLAYRELLGCQLSEVSGMQWKQVIYAPDKEMVYEEWESAVADKRPFDLRYRWINKDGKIIPIHAHASIIPSTTGGILGWVGFVTVLDQEEAANTN